MNIYAYDIPLRYVNVKWIFDFKYKKYNTKISLTNYFNCIKILKYKRGDCMYYQDTYIVRSSEIDTEYRLKPYHIGSYFQDTLACIFAKEGIAAFDLQKENRTWMLTNLRMDFLSIMPWWREKVDVKIWLRKIKGLKLFIDYIAKNQDNQIVSKGTSSWIIMDQSSKRPIKITHYISEESCEPLEAIPSFEFSIIQPIEGREYKLSQTIRSYDLDFNQHLNNIRYLAGAIETIPLEYRNSHNITSIDIKFQKEVYYKDLILSFVIAHEDNQNFFHKLIRKNDNEEICILRTKWEKKS